MHGELVHLPAAVFQFYLGRSNSLAMGPTQMRSNLDLHSWRRVQVATKYYFEPSLAPGRRNARWNRTLVCTQSTAADFRGSEGRAMLSVPVSPGRGPEA